MRVESLHARRTMYQLGVVVALVLLARPVAVQSGQGAANAQTGNTMPNFTGSVASLDAADVRGVRFRYGAAARSYWHAHDGPLVLLIEQGRGRAQVQGQSIQNFGPGQPVFLPANVPHWHGAAPDQGLTWVALSVGRDVKWMGPVSDDEYLGRGGK